VIKVEKSGYRPYEETIQVAAADRRVIAAELSRMIETAARGMVRVPAGEFFSGCNEKVDSECDEDEKPGKKRYVAAFAIDATEVTVEAYRECVRAGRCQEPEQYPFDCNWGRGDREAHPVNCVDWSQATTYCGWKGKRLPTEWEWEKAARGTDGQKYPWGNEQVSCRQAVIGEGRTGACGRGDTTFEVASKPLGVSPYGAHDMIGNVCEWTSSQYPGSTDPVVRGGWWGSEPGKARASGRSVLDPVYRYGFHGFRCAQ
jgi:formylglycine-generating enzyme required for sulfatase activity